MSLLVVALIILISAMLGWVPPASASSAPPSITTTSLDPGEVGTAYSQRLGAAGGVAPYRFSTSSPLPTGLTFRAVGVLTGTPEAAVEEMLTVTLLDAEGSTTTASLGLEIAPGPSITSTALPDPVVGEAYTAELQASGGTPPYSWSVTSGPLPLGLVLNSAGTLAGLPASAGTTTTTLTVSDAAGARASASVAVTVDPSPIPPATYFVATRSGSVGAFASPGVEVPQTGGDDPSRVVAIATDAAGHRYWLASASGHVTPSPGARSFGSVGAKRLSGQIVAIVALPDGAGYWLASSTGHVYGFGAARSFGSLDSRRFSGRIVGMATTPSGSGYWLASSTGHVYAFGTAHVLRRRGRGALNPSIVGVATDPSTGGYWLVTRAGRVYAFGGARSEGSIPGGRHVRSVAGIAASPAGSGYWLVLRSGAVDGFGSAPPLIGVEVGTSTGAVSIASAA